VPLAAAILFAACAAALLAALVLLARGAGYRAAGPLRLVVGERIDHGANLFTLRLRRPWRERWRPLPAFAAGQSVALRIPGEPTSRRYSLARWEALPWSYELTIRREPAGRFSPRLAAYATAGACLEVGAPAGRFALRAASPRRRAVMIAGGVGVTPLLSMIEHWAQRGGAYREIHLFWQLREPREAIYYHELQRFAARCRGFAVHVLVSRPPAGAAERLDVARLAAELGTLADADFYLCAGPALLDALLSGLAAAGVAGEAVHYERFAATTGAASAGDWQVSYRGQRFSAAGHRSLLDAIEAHGLAVDADCRNGSCGRCLLAVPAGRTRTLGMPEHVVPPGHVLACCAVPASDLELAAPR
jgi:ferredoxin-NADP reductase